MTTIPGTAATAPPRMRVTDLLLAGVVATAFAELLLCLAKSELFLLKLLQSLTTLLLLTQFLLASEVLFTLKTQLLLVLKTVLLL